MRKPLVSSLWLAALCAALLAAACSGDEPATVSEPQPQVSGAQASESAAHEDAQDKPATRSAQRAEDAEPTARPVEQASGGEEVDSSPKDEDVQQSESGPMEATASSPMSEREEEGDEEPAEDLTDVPGVVLADADVRVRPGLAWPTVDRLAAGEPVVALYRGGGWYRITYGDGHEGWIRSTAVDLGGINEWSVLRQAAPPILAVWRGVEYGVMGQSADGAEVRLLAVDDELSEILGAPKDEVTLLADDVTLEDLPILIGDETVVFPGDDFRAGQGRILPKANEWMWLPWGWLLAHNDEYIWQWRPDTNELEFIRRPQGYAKLSPDGRYLAIANLCSVGWSHDCEPIQRVIILPLDGSRPISLFDQLRRQGASTRVTWSYWYPEGAMQWSPDSSAVRMYVSMENDDERFVSFSLVFQVSGQVARFEEWSEFPIEDVVCETHRFIDDYTDHWSIDDGNVMTNYLTCVDDEGEHWNTWVEFTLSGEFLRFTEDSPWREWDHGAELIRSAAGGDELGDFLITQWSEDDRYALVVDLVAANVWVYDGDLHELGLVGVGSDVATEYRLWDPLDPDDDMRHFYALAEWHEGQAGIRILRHPEIRAALVVDAPTRRGQILDRGGPALDPPWPGSHGMRAEGTGYFLVSLPEVHVDGLAARHDSTFQLQIANRESLIVASVGIADTCERSMYHASLRHELGWSPDGEWFAVGGDELEGLWACGGWW